MKNYFKSFWNPLTVASMFLLLITGLWYTIKPWKVDDTESHDVYYNYELQDLFSGEKWEYYDLIMESHDTIDTIYIKATDKGFKLKIEKPDSMSEFIIIDINEYRN